MALVQPAEFNEAFSRLRAGVFRFEALQRYTSPDEAVILAAFLSGQPRPPDPGKQEWTAVEPAHVAMATMRGFELLDDRVVLEDTDRSRHLTEPTVVARFTAALTALRRRALSGPDAVAAIRRVEREL